MSINFTKQSGLFQDFRSIPHTDYQYLISFYDKHHKDISYLPFEEGMTILFYYSNALYEKGHYNKHITTAEKLLEVSIINNLDYIDGHDVYITLLYQKTAAHLRLGDTQKAIQLAQQLVGIDSNRLLHTELLQQCFLVNRPTWIRPTLMTSAVATIMAAVVIVLFASLHWYQIPNAMVMPYSLFATAGLGLLACAWGYYRHVIAPVRMIIAQAKEKAKNK